MTDHEQARELIALEGSIELSTEQQSWLRVHLRDCPACRAYAESAGQVVRALRAEPLPREPALVRAVQLRVQARTLELQQQRERVWLVWLSCAVVAVSTAITTPLLWWAGEWLGARAGVSNLAWQAGFTFFWIAPVLFASALLMARGTHLTNN
jgi:predicted anti-sigma-YlaC factor YlaD